MIIHQFETKKTARYGVLEPKSKCRGTVLALHGYRQLLPYFLPKFEVLRSRGYRVIAPEGLHRFYIDGYSGRVGASWMTKEDREQDIADYLHYLESLVDALKSDMRLGDLHLLGFSQGGATACRWMTHTQHDLTSLTLYASVFPNDFDFDGARELLSNMPSYMLFGDRDMFASEEVIQEKWKWLNGKGVHPKLMRFEGGHELYDSVLERLADEWDGINLS